MPPHTMSRGPPWLSCGHPRTTITTHCLPVACSSDEDILRAAWVARGRTACAAERTAREPPNSARIRIARATWAQQNHPYRGAKHPYLSSPLRALQCLAPQTYREMQLSSALRRGDVIEQILIRAKLLCTRYLPALHSRSPDM